LPTSSGRAACSRTLKRGIFEFVSNAIHADSKCVIFGLPDDFSFGIIQSQLHWEWIKARGGTQTARSTYTSDTVFDTFPWPQKPTTKQIRIVADAACELRALRRQIMDTNGWSLRDLYRTLETPGDNKLRDTHAALDTAVRSAYGMKPKDHILAFLLKLNLELADKESRGEPINPPGLPSGYSDPQELVSEDCVRPSSTELR
jgi:hypothetical protein